MNKIINSAIVFILLVLMGCQTNSIRTMEFYEQEKERISIEVENILLSLGFENISVFVYCHIKVDSSLLSQERYHTRYSGTGFIPEGPPDSISLYPDEQLFGYVVQNVTRTNYDTYNKGEYIYMNISILIIIDEITIKQKGELQKLFESYLINNERDDTIFIVSRKDFRE